VHVPRIPGIVTMVDSFFRLHRGILQQKSRPYVNGSSNAEEIDRKDGPRENGLIIIFSFE